MFAKAFYGGDRSQAPVLPSPVQGKVVNLDAKEPRDQVATGQISLGRAVIQVPLNCVPLDLLQAATASSMPRS